MFNRFNPVQGVRSSMNFQNEDRIKVQRMETPQSITEKSGAVRNLFNKGLSRRLGFDPWVGKILWRREWQSTPAFLPGKIPRTEEPGGLQSMGSQTVAHD